MHRPTTRPGFTLIELLVYLGMSTIVLVVISTLMVNLSASTARERTAHDLATTGQLIMNRLTYGVRTATGTPNVIGTTLEIPTESGTLTYALVGTNLTEALPSGVTETLNDPTVNVQSFILTNEGIGISVTLAVAPTTTTTPPVPAQQFSTTLVPRPTLYD